jgi:hypothetical protein
MVAGFCDHDVAIGVADKADIAFQLFDLLGGGQMGRKGGGGILHDRDVVTASRQQVEDTFRASAVDKAAVQQDHFLDRTGAPFGLLRTHINVSALLGQAGY